MRRFWCKKDVKGNSLMYRFMEIMYTDIIKKNTIIGDVLVRFNANTVLSDKLSSD